MKQKMAFIDLSNFTDWPMGGMLEYELAVLKYLVKHYDVDLWGVSVDGIAPHPVEIDGEKYKVNIYSNVHTRLKVVPNFWKGLGLVFSKKFRKSDYDVVYAHSGSCMTAASVVVNRNKTKLAYHQHGLSYLTNYSLMSLTQKPFYWISQRVSDVVFLVTDKKSASLYSKKMYTKSKAHFVGIGSPVNLSDFNHDIILNRIACNDSQKISDFIYVGRISAEKNVIDMIKALKIYISKSSNTDVKLHIIGDGPDRKNVERAIDKLGLNDTVILHGSVPHGQITTYLECADAFLITSNGEGVSISVLEAFASGLPVVCYSVPGLDSQNINGVTGAIAKNKTCQSFAEGMINVEKNIKQYSLNCLKEVKKYDASVIAKQIINEIDQI